MVESEPSESQDVDEREGQPDAADEPAPEAEPRIRADRAALMARYRALDGGETDGLPWSWSSLRPAELQAMVEVVDGFADSYNAMWAQTDTDTVPPCWHRHPALAHDLSALAWAYYQAYRDPRSTPDLALAFQAQLPGFRERMDYWLGADPAACRTGRHSRSAQRSTAPAPDRSRDTADEQDAVILLGSEDFGFPIESTVAAVDAEISAGQRAAAAP